MRAGAKSTPEAALRAWLADVAQMAIDWLDALDAPLADQEDDEREICTEDDAATARTA